MTILLQDLIIFDWQYDLFNPSTLMECWSPPCLAGMFLLGKIGSTVLTFTPIAPIKCQNEVNMLVFTTHYGNKLTTKIWEVQSSAVITRSHIKRYYMNDYRNCCRISIRYWIHKRHPIPRPNWRAMGCLLWIFVGKVLFIMQRKIKLIFFSQDKSSITLQTSNAGKCTWKKILFHNFSQKFNVSNISINFLYTAKYLFCSASQLLSNFRKAIISLCIAWHGYGKFKLCSTQGSRQLILKRRGYFKYMTNGFLQWNFISAGLILGLHPANERQRYKVTPSLIDWAQT